MKELAIVCYSMPGPRDPGSSGEPVLEESRTHRQVSVRRTGTNRNHVLLQTVDSVSAL